MAKSAKKPKKGKKGKNKNVSANKADSQVPPVTQQNTTAAVAETPHQQNETSHTVNRSRANRSDTLTCIYCGLNSDEPEWFVQCDDCDNFVHFQCAGIVYIREEDEWKCRNCTIETHNGKGQQFNDPNKSKEDGKTVKVKAIVHEPPKAQTKGQSKPSSVVQADDLSGIVTEPPKAQTKSQSKNPAVTNDAELSGIVTTDLSTNTEHLSNANRGITSTRVPTEKAKSARYNVRSKTSTASSRRVDLEIQRLEEEHRIQSECDAETLALKLEAVKLKAIREKIFVQEKHKALAEYEGSSKEGSGKSSSDKTERSSYVSQWINGQQRLPEQSKTLDDKQIRSIQRFDDKIDSLELDVSIPVYGHEIETIQKSKRRNLTPILERSNYVNDQIEDFRQWKQKQDEKLRQQELNHQSVIRTQLQLAGKRVPTLNSNQIDYPPKRQSFGIERINASRPRGLPELDQIFTLPASRSTMHPGQFYTRTITVGAQNSESTFTFCNTNQPMNPVIENSMYTYPRSQQHTQHTTSDSIKLLTSSQPIMSTRPSMNFSSNQNSQILSVSNPSSTANSSLGTNINFNQRPVTFTGNSNDGNQYYEQLYSYHSQENKQNASNSSSQNQHQISRNIRGPSQSATTNDDCENSCQPRMLTPSQIASRHALPKDLPRFSGNPKDWLRFIKRYNNSTSMCGYTDDENLERLDKCLEGKAYTLVESLLLMPDSVPEIIDTLKEKYGRPELIIKLVLSNIRNFPTIRPEKLELLSDFGYVVRNGCKQIEDMGLRSYLIDPELIQEIVDKLPFQTKIEWARYAERFAAITLNTLADWLHRLSRAINSVLTSDVSAAEQDTKFEKKKSNDENTKAKSGFVYVHNNEESKFPTDSEEKATCPVCERDCQSLENCSKFKSFDVDQRWKLLISKKLCRKCLKFHRRNCHISKTCGVNGCEYKHHAMLHNEQRHVNMNRSNINSNPKQSSNKDSAEITAGASNTHCMESGEMFRIVPVNLFANNRTISTFAFLDEGSHFTLLERQTANELGLIGVPETICMLWTKKVHRQEETEAVSFQIAGRYSNDSKEVASKYSMNSVNVVDELNLPEQTLQIDQLKQRFNHLRKIPIAGYEKVIPTLLIGVKHAKLAVPIESVEGNDDGPIATKSRLGWSVHGPTSNSTSGYVNHHGVSRCICHERDEEIHRQIKDHFSVENFGVVANNGSLDSKTNVKALKMLERLTLKKGNRFETGLLWKNEQYTLPDSYGMAMKRLQCLERKGPKVINVIDEAITDYIRKGYAHKLSSTELAENHKHVWYLPLFTVTNPKKPEKLRTVFDAAAKVKGMSLNSVLHTGPDLVPSIVEILRRFRENRIAVAGDIREMYHQVMVNDEDKHAQRFIWRNGELSKEPDIYVMDVLTFGSKSSPCSAQYVKNKNAKEFEEEYPRAATAITRNTYVDDLLDGTNTVREAVQLIQDTKFVHQQGGFEIRNFKSNSEEVLQSIGETVNNEKIPVDDGANIERVLGMFWDMKSDNFTFLLKFTKIPADVLDAKRVPTKRELLKLLMSVFDPLGLLQHFLVHLKILIQNTWRAGIKWDEKLPETLGEEWHRWFHFLPGVEEVKVPRWHFSEMSESERDIELHVFVDAGDLAYASVAYLRFKSNSGYMCSLVGSKSRVAPLKYMSTTRKELMAALLGTRFSKSVIESLTTKIKRRVFWSDSSTVLIWLRSDHQKYTQFVGHRVGEILETTELSEWRWVPSKINAADEATKWLKNPSFNQTDQWFAGPKFLYEEESNWPQQPTKIVPNGTTEEMKLSCVHSGMIMPTIINPANFSKWERAVRAVAFALRWGRKVLAKVRKLPHHMEPLTREELVLSERMLFRQAQWQGFTEEMVTLKRNLQRPDKPHHISKDSAIQDCTPFLDKHGIMRVEGRLDKATALSMDTKHPIIMPRDHLLTKLLMMSYHRKFLHKNHETAVNELRQRFYVPRMRVAFRSVRWNCQLCKIKRSRPQVPNMATLPAIRFEPGVRPFTYTGVDYFGPMGVKIGRRCEKRWGVLFTCLTIRAIHIEIVSSLDTGACIKALRNFTNLRGKANEYFSDRGTHFVGADNELKQELEKLDEKELAATVTSCYTRWNFNPPASPHMGGCWERLICTVKVCLNQSMTTHTPQVDDLRSLLLEAMNIVNARPLTYIPIDSFESEALTPNHFLLGASNGIKPPGNFRTDGPYLRQTWKEIQRCADIFWDRFIKEYVTTLTRSTKWFDKVKPIQIGDIVLDIDESNPRNTYPKARVVETIMGSRSQVRRIRVQYANGSTLWRPAKRLAVLDLQGPEEDAAPTNEASLVLPPTNETGGNSVGATNRITGDGSIGDSDD